VKRKGSSIDKIMWPVVRWVLRVVLVIVLLDGNNLCRLCGYMLRRIHDLDRRHFGVGDIMSL
jgi:hypothetical protein